MLHSLANIDAYAYYVKVYANSFSIPKKKDSTHKNLTMDPHTVHRAADKQILYT